MHKDANGKPTPIAKLVEAAPSLKSYTYVPYIWAWNKHLQSLCFAPYTVVHEDVPYYQTNYENELFTLSDGDQIYICWPYKKPEKPGKKPLLVVYGGLSGNN